MNQQPRSSDTFPMWPVLTLLGMFGVLLVIVLAGNVTRTVPVTPPPSPTEVAQVPTATLVLTQLAEVAAVSSNPAVAAQGRNTFLGTCAACHGPDARGITGLGKNLVTSPFVHSLNDDDLLAFIQKGRTIFDSVNTTGVEMPPRGGNPGLTDTDLRNVIAYLRSIGGPPTVSGQQAAAVPTVAATAAPTAVSSEPTREFVILGANISALPSPSAPEARTGQQVYAWACASCHSASGEGVPYDGPSLTHSGLLNTDAGLISLLTNPQISDLSGGFIHPYRGGYPPLSDEELGNLIVYLKMLSG